MRPLAGAVLLLATAAAAQELWRGLAVAPEHRCSAYQRSDYPYPQSVERALVRGMDGRIYGPYTGRTFANTRQTQIEHIVALSEAHDSGLCAADAATRARFAADPLNLTLAAGPVNRAKGGRDAAGWLPARNRCWFAARVVAVRRKYALQVDAREARALERVLASCPSTAMVFHDASAPPAAPAAGAQTDSDALGRYDDNGNGRISCREARRHGIAPVARGHPAYAHMRDGDGDGTVCE